MAQYMGRDPFFDQRRTVNASCRNVFVHQVLDGIRAEPPTREAGEKELGRNWPGFLHPSVQHPASRFRKGSAALLPTFSDASDVRAKPKRNILATKPSEFRQAQARLHGNQQQGIIPSADPPLAVHGLNPDNS